MRPSAATPYARLTVPSVLGEVALRLPILITPHPSCCPARRCPLACPNDDPSPRRAALCSGARGAARDAWCARAGAAAARGRRSRCVLIVTDPAGTRLTESCADSCPSAETPRTVPAPHGYSSRPILPRGHVREVRMPPEEAQEEAALGDVWIHVRVRRPSYLRVAAGLNVQEQRVRLATHADKLHSRLSREGVGIRH